MRSPLRRGLWLVCSLLGSALAMADDGAQRRLIADERSQVQAHYQAAMAECGQRFAVTACANEAKAQRRLALEQLRQRRAALDEARRRQKAADRQMALDQRQPKTSLASQAEPTDAAGTPLRRRVRAERGARPPTAAASPRESAASAALR